MHLHSNLLNLALQAPTATAGSATASGSAVDNAKNAALETLHSSETDYSGSTKLYCSLS
jgi:hypothetical protein